MPDVDVFSLDARMADLLGRKPGAVAVAWHHRRALLACYGTDTVALGLALFDGGLGLRTYTDATTLARALGPAAAVDALLGLPGVL